MKGDRYVPKILSILKPRMKILDIGCGTAYIIQRAPSLSRRRPRELGHVALGEEPVEALVPVDVFVHEKGVPGWHRESLLQAFFPGAHQLYQEFHAVLL